MQTVDWGQTYKMEPITISAAVAAGTAAFNTIKNMIAAGRDLESCINDVSRWMKAASDIDQADKRAKNPSVFKKLQGADTVQQEAIQVFAAKKKNGTATRRAEAIPANDLRAAGLGRSDPA